MGKHFIFTIDDNIRFFEETEKNALASIFDNPYLALLKRLHRKYSVKIQLNLFYEKEDFNLSMFSNKYAREFDEASDWLKLSFHSKLENVDPYKESGYDEVYRDGAAVNREILRFAGERSLGKTTTLHYCTATKEGLSALYDIGILGLLGLYGKERTSYQNTESESDYIDKGNVLKKDGISFAGIDVVLNLFDIGQIREKLFNLLDRSLVKIMIHEQYFYPDYKNYQPDFERKLDEAFKILTEAGYKSKFYEEVIEI